MKPYYDDGQVAMYAGDVRDVLREMPAESVQMCVTSPPYWSLRDYGVEPTIWGERPNLYICPQIPGVEPGKPHDFEPETSESERYEGKTRWQHVGGREGFEEDTVERGQIGRGETCRRCGAWRGALGLEPTPEQFIAHTVEVFREVRRVLRADGTCWINIGDSYAGSPASGGAASSTLVGTPNAARPGGPVRATAFGLKPKDLVGIPWMLAFALRADGWYLRQEIIWHKPNPMPESVRDRCTKAHESLFLLSKSPRYHYDAKAIDEIAEYSDAMPARDPQRNPKQWAIGQNMPGPSTMGAIRPGEGRNKRSVWSIPTEPFPEAHFATYPTALVEPCILAGCPEGGVVLDPFLGSGTTALVARRLGRRCIGIDLKPEYLDMAVRRAGGQLSLELTGEAS